MSKSVINSNYRDIHGAPRALDIHDYPGQSCWDLDTNVHMFSYNAMCKSVASGTHGDVIMFNAGSQPALSLNSNATFSAKYPATYSIATRPSSNNNVGIWLNLLKNGSQAQCDITRDDYGLHWTHTVSLSLPQRSPSAKYFLTNVEMGAFCFIIANADSGVVNDAASASGSVASKSQSFEFYGYHAGMVLSQVSTTTDLTNGHSYVLTFTNVEDIGWEAGPPMTVWNYVASPSSTDPEGSYYDATKTAITSWIIDDETALSQGVSSLSKRIRDEKEQNK